MATIAEYIFSYQLSNADVPRITVQRLLAHASSSDSITVLWSDTNYVKFEYVKDDQSFDPIFSPGQAGLLCIGGKVEPRTYSTSEFIDLLSDALVIRFKYTATLKFPTTNDAVIVVDYKPNYRHIIRELEKKGFVETTPSSNVMCTDPLRFRIKGEEDMYEVDCLGSRLFVDLSQQIETLYINAFYPSLTPLKS